MGVIENLPTKLCSLLYFSEVSQMDPMLKMFRNKPNNSSLWLFDLLSQPK